MKRRVLLIMNPGSGDHNVSGVEGAYNRYKNFLMSPVGGFWQKEEILEMRRACGCMSQQSEFCMQMRELNQLDVDYSMIVFIGHGGAVCGHDIIQLEDGETLSISELLKPINHTVPIKRTVVIDACRKIIPIEENLLLLEQREFSGCGRIVESWCKVYYNRLITEAEPHVELIQSTQYDTYAQGTKTGTAFTDALFGLLKDNTTIWNNFALKDDVGEHTVSYRDVMDDIKKRMVSWNQVPEYTNNSATTFPLFAVKRPVSKAIDGGSVVGILED